MVLIKNRPLGRNTTPRFSSHLPVSKSFPIQRIRMRMDSSDSEDHPGEDDFMKYRYYKDGGIVKEIIKHTG